MKYIKSFNEYKHETNPDYESLPIDDKDLKLIKRYLGDITIEEFSNNEGHLGLLINHQFIVKMNDGLWMVNDNMEFESLKEVCEMIKDYDFTENETILNKIVKELEERVVKHDPNLFYYSIKGGGDVMRLNTQHKTIDLDYGLFLKLTKNDFSLYSLFSVLDEIIIKQFDLTDDYVIYDDAP